MGIDTLCTVGITVTTTRVEEELGYDFGFDLDLATALKALITVEGLLYVVINVRMLKRWVSFNLCIFCQSFLQVSMGKLKSLVNKFLVVNRLHGLVIVPILTLDPLLGPLVPFDSKNFYCRSIEVIL